MQSIIYQHQTTANGIEITSTKRVATPHAKRKGYRYVIEKIYRNLETGTITKDYHYTKK
jgi:hypothetical protein